MSKLTQGQVIIVVTLGVVMIALAAIIATLVLTGGVKTAAEVTFLIGIIGTLAGLFGAVLKLGQVSQQINGHIEQHVEEAQRQQNERTAEVMQPMIDQAIARTLAGQTDIVSQLRPMISEAAEQAVRLAEAKQSEVDKHATEHS